jgi:hypothetical protein
MMMMGSWSTTSSQFTQAKSTCRSLERVAVKDKNIHPFPFLLIKKIIDALVKKNK